MIKMLSRKLEKLILNGKIRLNRANFHRKILKARLILIQKQHSMEIFHKRMKLMETRLLPSKQRAFIMIMISFNIQGGFKQIHYKGSKVIKEKYKMKNTN